MLLPQQNPFQQQGAAGAGGLGGGDLGGQDPIMMLLRLLARGGAPGGPPVNAVPIGQGMNSGSLVQPPIYSTETAAGLGAQQQPQFSSQQQAGPQGAGPGNPMPNGYPEVAPPPGGWPGASLGNWTKRLVELGLIPGG